MGCGEVMLRRGTKELEHNAVYALPGIQRITGVDEGDMVNLRRKELRVKK
jgi:hypothetical protein